MRNWLFQGNPLKLDINGYIQSSKEINWVVKQKYYAPKMFIGDEVFIWRSDGKDIGSSGVIARALMLSLPYQHTEWQGDNFKLDPSWSTAGLGVDLELQEARPYIGYLSSLYFKHIDALKDLGILRSCNKTNFLLTKEEADALRGLWL